eukprot:CAMPEP_0169138464 /NCGR_PEP_ID=MMETSP1015-20121227/42269_1 /TAXON_ID=342587 /ORGANISM="Karlodinium micrum, Strain CCMP2283" /LENGTH=205 /DNA_ID=CAMNT_0009203743 /DNA_START=71 /DNA_END=685 /DNA_ORIENTATION=-
MYLGGNFDGLVFTERNTFMEFADEDVVYRIRRNSAPSLMWRYEFSPPCPSVPHSPSTGGEAENSSQDNDEDSISGNGDDVGLKDCCNLIVKNIPCSLKKHEIVKIFEEKGFMKLCNFFYLPTRHGKNLGYAFIGFPYPLLAEAFFTKFHRHQIPRKQSKKVLCVEPSSIQGLASNLEHFKNTQVINTAARPLFRNFVHHASDRLW